MNGIKNPSKRAFTLTELLIVVIVIGVLSAVTLPKFNRVIENRKVTEAEEMMSAVRTEQERRCSLNQNYTTKFDNLSDVIASSNTKDYSYSLQSQGISAKSNSSDYTLRVLSYQDGDFCCEGAGCKKLNKNYPNCADVKPTVSACMGTDAGNGGNTPDPVEPAECTDGEVSGAQVCNDCGTQTTLKCVGGKWTASLGACSKTAEECAPQCGTQPADAEEKCPECGVKKASYYCDASTGYKWVLGAWSKCIDKPADVTETCSDGSTTRTKPFTCEYGVWTPGNWDKECPAACPDGKAWDGASCVCKNEAEKASCADKPSFISIGSGANRDIKDVTIHYEWDEDTCSCTCPRFGNEGLCSTTVGSMVTLGEWDTQKCDCKPQATQPYYFKCVTRIVSDDGSAISMGDYPTKSAAQQACLTQKDTDATFNEYLSGGTTVPGCKPYQDSSGRWVECALSPAYYIQWKCSTEPPHHASGYGFDEVLCAVVVPHE